MIQLGKIYASNGGERRTFVLPKELHGGTVVFVVGQASAGHHLIFDDAVDAMRADAFESFYRPIEAKRKE